MIILPRLILLYRSLICIVFVSIRNCEADLHKIKSDLRAALEMMVQHRLAIQKRIEGVLSAAKQAHNDVQMGALALA